MNYSGYNSDVEIITALCSPLTRDKAFSSLLDSLQQPIYYHLRRLLGNHEDADDAAQETFIQVYKSISGFRKESKLSTWIFSIATRKGLDLIKKRKHLNRFDSLEGFNNAVETLKSDIYFDGDEVSTQLHAAVLTLPLKQRVVFILKYFESLDYLSISQATDTSVGSLKASYHHATTKIKTFFSSKVNLHF